MLTVARQAEAFNARLVPKFLALHYFREGDLQAFAQELSRYNEMLGIHAEATALLTRAARDEISRNSLADRLEPYSIRRNNFFALELAMLGQNDRALDALLRWPSQEGSFIDDMWLPEFREVRTLPRFRELIRRMDLDDYWQAHGAPDACNHGAPEPFCDVVAPITGT